MADDVAGNAAETAGAHVEAVVETAVAQVEGALENAEARAEAAEELNETILESARRDALHDEIEAVQEGLEECREHLQGEVDLLRQQLVLCQTEMQALRDQMTELANRSTVVTLSTPAPSETGEVTPAAETQVTVQTVKPEGANVPTPEAVAAPANKRRWI